MPRIRGIDYSGPERPEVYGARLQVYKSGLVPCDRNADCEVTETVYGYNDKDALHDALVRIAEQMGYRTGTVQMICWTPYFPTYVRLRIKRYGIVWIEHFSYRADGSMLIESQTTLGEWMTIYHLPRK